MLDSGDITGHIDRISFQLPITGYYDTGSPRIPLR